MIIIISLSLLIFKQTISDKNEKIFLFGECPDEKLVRFTVQYGQIGGSNISRCSPSCTQIIAIKSQSV